MESIFTILIFIPLILPLIVCLCFLCHKGPKDYYLLCLKPCFLKMISRERPEEPNPFLTVISEPTDRRRTGTGMVRSHSAVLSTEYQDSEEEALNAKQIVRKTTIAGIFDDKAETNKKDRPPPKYSFAIDNPPCRQPTASTSRQASSESEPSPPPSYDALMELNAGSLEQVHRNPNTIDTVFMV